MTFVLHLTAVEFALFFLVGALISFIIFSSALLTEGSDIPKLPSPSINYYGAKSGGPFSDLSVIQVLDTPYVIEYSMPNGTWPNGILVDKHGTVWTVSTKSHTLIKFDPKSGKVQSSYPLKSLDSQKTENDSQSAAQSEETDSIEPTPQQNFQPVPEAQLSATEQVSSQPGNSYVNENCGRSIELSLGWTAIESDFVFKDQSKTLADFQSEHDDIFQLELALENFGVAKYSPLEILKSEREYANLSPNAHVLKSEWDSQWIPELRDCLQYWFTGRI